METRVSSGSGDNHDNEENNTYFNFLGGMFTIKIANFLKNQTKTIQDYTGGLVFSPIMWCLY